MEIFDRVREFSERVLETPIPASSFQPAASSARISKLTLLL